MRIRYVCGHESTSSYHKDGLELVRVNIKCVSCKKSKIRETSNTKIVLVGKHTLVLKRARVVE